MSEDLVQINEQRALKANDNRLWSPLECAKALVRDIESGKINPQNLLVCYYEPRDNGGRSLDQYSANLDFEEALAMAVLLQHNTVSRWRNG